MMLKLKVPQWHYSLLTDYERLAIFKNAIERVVDKDDVVFDLGTGSAILAMIAAKNAKRVYAIELDSFTYDYAKENIKVNGFNNIEIIEGDATTYKFKEKADVVIAELLDTALITEPQVKVMNSIIERGFLKEDAKIIPAKAISTIQLVEAKMNHIYYDEDIKSEEVSEEIIYEEVNFYKINPIEVSYNIELELEKSCENLGIKLRTYTILDDKHIAGQTPMLNPPLVIPLNKKANKGKVKINLSYGRGKDLESIKVNLGYL
ncbi:50S ribosomal protein L11 methyltransferase [Methanocaldococcus sp. 28A]